MSDWIKQVDVVLKDEEQQYGNMEEAATVARTPCTCFEIWSGDHRQHWEDYSRQRRSDVPLQLFKRPLALRCPTECIQSHADIATWCPEGHSDSPQVTLARFLREDIITACSGR